MEKKKKKGGGFTTFLLVLIFVAGLSLMLYPTFSNYWNSLHQTRVIASYAEEVANMNDEEYTEIWQAARDYNNEILSRRNPYVLPDEKRATYEALLNIGGSGIMGYVEIPSIEVTLPIYHGTSDAVLQVASGHLEWTSLPVGGSSTHTVLSGHRGLPSAKLFTDLDELREGDVFMLRVLDEVLTYEVDQILIVLPTDTENLQIVGGKDYCTLTTCTPYGINTHRMLVRGHRIETEEQQVMFVRVAADAVRVEPMVVAAIVGIILLILYPLLMPRKWRL